MPRRYCRNESKFLLWGLQVERKATWEERQATYLAAVRHFLALLKPEFETVKIKFVKAIHFDPKLFLSVECGSAEQYVSIYSIYACIAFSTNNYNQRPTGADRITCSY